MNKTERAQRIIHDFIAIPQHRWLRTTYRGQGVFEVRGLAGYALYFSKTLTNSESQHADRDVALEKYHARLGTKLYALEVFDGDYKCVCLLRWDVLDDIEVAEYVHGPWETLSFGLPPLYAALSPTCH